MTFPQNTGSEVFPSWKIVLAKFYTTPNYFNSKGFLFPLTLTLLLHPPLHIVRTECQKYAPRCVPTALHVYSHRCNFQFPRVCMCHTKPRRTKASCRAQRSLSGIYFRTNTRKREPALNPREGVKLLFFTHGPYWVLALLEKKGLSHWELETWCKNSQA